MSGSFLSRWSKRKQEAKDSAVVDARPPESDESPKNEPSPPEPPLELPSIESLGATSDYSAFLKPGVPAGLRQEALQKLWATNPALMAPEVMDLHMGDYSSPPVAEVVKTAWRLGKGVLDAVELAAEEEENKSADSDC